MDRLEQLHPRPEAAGAFVAQFPAIYRFVSNKWYFDELYDVLFVRPALWLGRLFWKGGDEGTIDRFGPHGAAYAVGVGNRITARLQSGYLYSYALVMLLGLIGAASWAIWWAQVSGLPLLSILIAVPLVAGVLCLFLERQRRALDRARRDAARPRARRRAVDRLRPERRAMAVRRERRRSAAGSTGRSASTASRWC